MNKTVSHEQFTRDARPEQQLKLMPKRVLHVIPCLGHGGAEHQLALNVAGLDATRFESHVVHLSPPALLAPQIKAAGVPVHSAVSEGAFGGPARLRRLLGLVRSLEIDLIHTSNIEGEFYGAALSWLSRKPAIATLTNTSDDELQLIDNPHLNRLKLAIVRNGRRGALRLGHDHYVAISHHVKDSAVRRLGLAPDKISVIYRGIQLGGSPQMRPPKRSLHGELGLNDDALVVLTVGRLVPQKGQRYLIEAMPAVLRQNPRAVLLIAGVGFLDSSLKELATRLGVSNSVRFLGRRDDVPALLESADIFVFPSVYEGLGVSLIEAAAAGKACVATAVGPLPEVIEHGESGVLVSPQSSGELAQAITRLGQDADLRARLGCRAAETAQHKFAIGRAVGQLEQVYADVLESRTVASTGKRSTSKP